MCSLYLMNLWSKTVSKSSSDVCIDDIKIFDCISDWYQYRQIVRQFLENKFDFVLLQNSSEPKSAASNVTLKQHKVDIIESLILQQQYTIWIQQCKIPLNQNAIAKDVFVLIEHLITDVISSHKSEIITLRGSAASTKNLPEYDALTKEKREMELVLANNNSKDEISIDVSSTMHQKLYYFVLDFNLTDVVMCVVT